MENKFEGLKNCSKSITNINIIHDHVLFEKIVFQNTAPNDIHVRITYIGTFSEWRIQYFISRWGGGLELVFD